MTGFSVLKEFLPRVVAVSGGGSGIGRAVARDLALRGFDVIIMGRTKESLHATAEGRPGIHCFVVDVVDAVAVENVISEVENDFGPVDVLIANAAIYPKVHFLDQSAENFALTMRTNTEGVANLIRSVLPGMLARNLGRIIVVGSLADINPIPTAVSYSVSKGALRSLVRGIAAEIDRARYPNVLINEILPGPTRTTMSASGQPPEALCVHFRTLIDLPTGGPTGRSFVEGKEIHIGESWKQAIKRKLGLHR